MSRIVKIFSTAAALQEQPGEQLQIGRRDSQMLYGEEFETDRVVGAWAHGISRLDGYEGYVRLADIREGPASTHAVVNLATHAYPQPDFKTPPSLTLSFMSRVAIDTDRNKNGFAATAGGRWIPENHLMALKDLKSNPADIADTAMMFCNTPYHYSGRSFQGIDCSGLTQLALQRNGVEDCPRDADQQQNVIGLKVKLKDIQRGDLVYFPGHVGIMADDKTIINATVRHMKVVVEPLKALVAHYGGKNAILAIRRPFP